MAKLAFPQVVAPYRGFVGEVRGWMNRIATWSDRVDAAGKAVMATQIRPLVEKLSGILLTVGVGNVALHNYQGNAYTPARTLEVVGGATPHVRMYTTALPLTSGTKVLMPAATGSYTTGYTFTIVNGAITAVVAS